jgi:AraC-like DNA-binding protein
MLAERRAAHTIVAGGSSRSSDAARRGAITCIMQSTARDIEDAARRDAPTDAIARAARAVDKSTISPAAFRAVYATEIDPERHRHGLECLFAFVARRLATGAAAHPLAMVVFPHRAPRRGEDLHRSVFACDVVFGGSAGALRFAAGWLDRPLASADPALFELVRPHVERLVAQRMSQESVADAARRCLLESLEREPPTVDLVARRLCVSKRTLQRKLWQDGLTFKELYDDVRRTAAERYIASGRMTISEAARRLGFSDVSTFSRAFRRWTGDPPSRARARPPNGVSPSGASPDERLSHVLRHRDPRGRDRGVRRRDPHGRGGDGEGPARRRCLSAARVSVDAHADVVRGRDHDGRDVQGGPRRQGVRVRQRLHDEPRPFVPRGGSMQGALRGGGGDELPSRASGRGGVPRSLLRR